jgi:hypothetical protein
MFRILTINNLFYIILYTVNFKELDLLQKYYRVPENGEISLSHDDEYPPYFGGI